MPVIADSYMGIFIPADISHRIRMFMAAKVDFPFIKKDEIMAAFYLFGKNYGAEDEIDAATDIAKRTVEQMARDIRLYTTMPQKRGTRFMRENYMKRSLQIVVDTADDQLDIDRRVAGDPTILSDCYAQHIAYYNQCYFFELFQPFKAEQLPAALQGKLKGRMLLLGFNVKNRQSLPFKSSLEPFFKWMLSKV
ncbi:MAG TPA: hypothetical protein VE199_02575 [Nitrososphaera sp.]|nr:hypothetical protein [Nitrososphaera sp.]